MLRQIRTKQGREHVVPLLLVMSRLKLASDEAVHLAILQVIFNEYRVGMK